jgi:transposase InsO family protein
MDLKIAKELHKPVRKHFERRKIITKGINELWAADLLIMTTVSTKINKGYKYMLNVMDTFTKFAWIEPLKKKNGKSVSEAFTKILEKSKQSPKILHTDAGKEFLNKDFQQVLDKNDIKMYQTFSEIKSSIIERFNRTINQKLKVQFEVNQNTNLIDIIDKILYEYNFKDTHRTIGKKPCEVNKSNEKQILERMFVTFTSCC